MRIVHISDTHNLHRKVNLPTGNVLVHSGDFTGRGTVEEEIKFNSWLQEIKANFDKIVIVRGNHELGAEKQPNIFYDILHEGMGNKLKYLENQATEIDGFKFYGSPQTPEFFNWAYNVERGPNIKRYWDAIPDDTEILITHGPPYNVLDMMPRGSTGCGDLSNRIQWLPKLKLHCFGHIHPGYGKILQDGVIYSNASICDDSYRPVNQPNVIDLVKP